MVPGFLDLYYQKEMIHMALSSKARARLTAAMAHKVYAKEVADALDMVSNGGLNFVAQTPLTAAGAIDLVSGESSFTNGGSGSYAVTLAAPVNQDGQVKVLKAGATMSHTVTLAMTNIVTYNGSSGTTTLTFTSVGDCVV